MYCQQDGQVTSSSTGVKLDSSSYTLSNMIKDFNLTDVFKSKNPLSPGFTWSNGGTSSRIDFLTYFSGVTPLDCSMSPVPFSDHSKLICSLDIPGLSRPCAGPSKLNVSLLAKEKIVQ